MRVDHSSGFSLIIPEGWKITEDPTSDIAVIALAPPDASGFSRNIVATVGPLEPEWDDITRWQHTAADALVGEFDDAQLIDVITEDDAFRQLISYVADGHALTLEQWAWRWERPDGVYAMSLSATTPTLAFAEHIDESAGIRASWYATAGEQE